MLGKWRFVITIILFREVRGRSDMLPVLSVTMFLVITGPVKEARKGFLLM